MAGSEPLYRELCLFTSGVSGRPLIVLTETHTGCLEHCSMVNTAVGPTLPARAAATLRNAASQTLLVSTLSSVTLFGQTPWLPLAHGSSFSASHQAPATGMTTALRHPSYPVGHGTVRGMPLPSLHATCLKVYLNLILLWGF